MAYDLFDRKHEILVAGGGLTGWAAAVTSARAGRQVLLVSRRAQLGWEITCTLNGHLGGNRNSPLAGEMLSRLADQGAADGTTVYPPAVELLLHQMAEEAGLELLLYATPLCPVQTQGGRIAGILVGGKSGQHTLRADLVVDATDTALLARDAGLPIRQAGDVPGRSVIMLNGLSESLAETIDLGPCGPATSISVRPSLYSGEAVVEFTLPTASPADAHLAVPQVLAFVRERVPATGGALVTTMSVEPLPLAPQYTCEQGGDLLGRAGLRVAGPATEGDTAADLIARGEAAGRAAAEAWAATDDSSPADAGSLLPAPPHEEADVVVVGGGTAGAVAAIAAARQGAKTTLLEPLTYLGGIGTGGGIHIYYHGVSGGLQDELDRRVAELSPLFIGPHDLTGWNNQAFHPDAKKVALLQMATEAGVRLEFATTATGVMTESFDSPLSDSKAVARLASGGKPPVCVTAVVAAGPDGVRVCQAPVFVDSTGDGDVAAMAGAQFTYGREGDGLLHAFSQSAGRIEPAKDADGNETGQLRMVIVNFDAGYVDPDDLTDLTRARGIGLNPLRLERWTDDQRWTYIAPHLGLRQGRQIVGDYRLTLGDEILGQQFPDAIAYAVSHYDNHAFDYENESDSGAIWAWLLGQWQRRIGCEVPYRCLLPQRVEGLLVACRALSLTQDAHYQLRMQRDMQRIGEAAGIAAALAARQGATPRGIDVAELQAVLRDLGALNEQDRPRPALAEATAEELVERLGSAEPFDAAWQLAHGHQDSLPVLRRSLESDLPARRFWSAATLAMAGDASGAAELVAAVRERRDDKPQGHRKVGQWLPSIVLLGRVGEKSALPVLCEVLEDRDAPTDAVMAAVLALGRIGDPSAELAIRKLLGRSDLDAVRRLQVSVGVKYPTTEDIRWQVDLTAAEALARMGRPDASIAEPYLEDQRAYVRRRARQVVAM